MARVVPCRFRGELFQGQVAKKRDRAQGRAEALEITVIRIWRPMDSKPFLEGKWITRRHHESGNVFFCANEMCLLRIRFLQLKFPCQQVFGWQAGGFQHRATGWDWVNIGSAWPSSFNSAYSCGVSMFCVVLSCDFTQHGAFLQEAEAAAKRAVAVTWIFAVA